MTAVARRSDRFSWAGYLLGFALGGFFDGILLHQILQWHHLLSLVDGVGDIRNQILFDGLFHALMYLIAFVGLILLARSRGALDEAGAARLLTGNALLGFGIWHLLDSLLSHWLLGIHRIKIDSPNPLLWDLIWFAAFGLVPLIIGLLIRRGAGPGSPALGGRSAALGMVLLILTAGPWAARSPADDNSAIAVFRPGMNDGAIVGAIAHAGGYVLWQSRGVWAVKWQADARSAELYRRGALLVSNSLVGAGCLAWARAGQ